MDDFYFKKEYAELYEKAENGVAVQWNYEGPEGKVQHLFIKRRIKTELPGGPWYDLVTPYGYGGPRIINCTGEKKELLTAFEHAFTDYCQQNNVVSEFIRFHVLENNAIDFQDIYNSKFDRYTVGTNLRDYSIEEEFSSKCRKTIRQIERKGVTSRVTYQPESLKDFKKVYYSTMERNNASEYYFFDDAYFDNLLSEFQKNILLVEALVGDDVAAVGLYVVFNGIIHCHLSGTLAEYLKFSPAYMIKMATASWGKENDVSLIHYGGGKSSSEDDELYRFKKHFGQHTKFPFYIGKKVWNDKVYQKLCDEKAVAENCAFFPAYRCQ